MVTPSKYILELLHWNLVITGEGKENQPNKPKNHTKPHIALKGQLYFTLQAFPSFLSSVFLLVKFEYNIYLAI